MRSFLFTIRTFLGLSFKLRNYSNVVKRIKVTFNFITASVLNQLEILKTHRHVLKCNENCTITWHIQQSLSERHLEPQSMSVA